MRCEFRTVKLYAQREGHYDSTRTVLTCVTRVEIAREKQWPSTWLNNQAAAYAARNPGEGLTVFDHPHLQVMATPAEHLLAMKVLAARAVRDTDDALILLQHLNIRTADEVWEIVGRYFTDTMISDRSRLFVDEIIDRIGGDA